MRRGCCPLQCKHSPLPSLTRYPSMAAGIPAGPLVSDQTALLDRHCSCKHIETMKPQQLQKSQPATVNMTATRVTPQLSSPSKWWETTKQDVGDDSCCPDVHFKAITIQRHTNISTSFNQRSVKICSGSHLPPSQPTPFLPCFCNNFRCYICRGPTDGVKRSVHHGG